MTGPPLMPFRSAATHSPSEGKFDASDSLPHEIDAPQRLAEEY